jgi:hypothetical protein
MRNAETISMYLRDLSINVSPDAKLPDGFSRREFHSSIHAAQEIFLSSMPRKYVLDGTGKTNLTFGPSGGRPRYRRLLNVNEYFVEDFDFVAHTIADTRYRDEMILVAIETSLLDIASKFDADPEPIQKAISYTRSCGCERRGVLPRLSRLTKSRRLKLNVFRHIFHGGESWGIEITNRKGELLETVWIAEKTDWLRARYNYRRSILKGDKFVILDWIGREVYKLDAGKLEARLLPPLRLIRRGRSV